MINFMSPVATTDSRPKSRLSASWLALFWRRHHPVAPEPVPVTKILDLVDRVRRAEHQLAMMKAQAQ